MKRKQTHLQYALAVSAIGIVLGVALYIGHLSMEPWAAYVTLIPLLLFIITNAKAYSKANDHYVTFGNVFGSGFKLSLIVALIMAVWGGVSMLLFPEMKDMILEKAEEEMLKQGSSEEQIEMGMKWTRQFFEVFAVIGSFFMYLFWGTIFSLIGAAIAKKKGERPPFHNE